MLSRFSTVNVYNGMHIILQAVWSRFFPVYEAIKKDIKSGNLGEVNMVTAQLCKPNISERKTNRKDLMGGILLLLGIYPVQFVMHVYGEMPEKIIAVGSLNEEGTKRKVLNLLQHLIIAVESCDCKTKPCNKEFKKKPIN